MGSRTGRAAGYCSGFGAPGHANPMPGGGRGRGFGPGFGARRGGGRGWGAWGDYGPPMADPPAQGAPGWTPAVEGERQQLESHVKALQAQIKSLSKRLSDLVAREAKRPEGKE